MTKSEAAIGICLHQLATREEVVIKRVVAFSGSQGRNYQLTDLPEAQIIVVSDENPLDPAMLNTAGSIIIRIEGKDDGQPYDVLMSRPLLVTRVMRTLDEANALLQTDVAEPESETGVEVVQEIPVPPVIPAEPESPVREETLSDHPDTGQTASEITVIGVIEEGGMPPELPDGLVDHDIQPELTGDPVNDITQSEPGTNQQEGDFHHRALVVDDSAAIRKQLQLELHQAGIGADFAEDGEQALEKVAANHYDLIFLDIIMPGIDGYETCRQMRLHHKLKKTPIIMLSAKTSPLDEVQGVIAGASTYLTKPVKSEQLQSTLKRVAMWIDNFQATT